MSENKFEPNIKCKNFCPYDKNFCPFGIGCETIEEKHNMFKQDVIPEKINVKKNTIKPQPKKYASSSGNSSSSSGGEVEWMSFSGTVYFQKFEFFFKGAMFDLQMGSFSGNLKYLDDDGEPIDDDIISITGYISTNEKSCDFGGDITISSKNGRISLNGNFKTNYSGGGGVVDEETNNTENPDTMRNSMSNKSYSGTIELNNNNGKIFIQTSM